MWKTPAERAEKMIAQTNFGFSGDDGPLGSKSSSRRMEPNLNSEPVDRGQVGPEFGLQLLALGQIRGVGIHTLQHLLRVYGRFARIWEQDEPALLRVLLQAK